MARIVRILPVIRKRKLLDLPTMVKISLIPRRSSHFPEETNRMYRFKLNTMTCGGCAAAVTRAIHAVDKSARVNTYPSIRRVEVETSLSSAQLLGIFQAAGYPAETETDVRNPL